MKTMLGQNSQSRLEAREGVLCIVVETPFSGGRVRGFFPRDAVMVPGRGARCQPGAGRQASGPQHRLFIDEEGNS
jgi:hypothetical protein